MVVVTKAELTAEEKKYLEEIKRELNLALKTGVVKFGYRSTLKALQKGEVEAVVISENIPKEMKAMILYLAALSNVPVVNFPGSARELGEISGRPHIISTLAVIEAGTSKIRELGKVPQL